MTLWNWLEGVKPGLGVYLHVFEKYGADALDDLEHLDETEITKILEEIQIENKDLLPLVVRKLGSACRARIAAGAAAAAAAATAAMFTPPPAQSSRPKGGATLSSDEEELEEDSLSESSSAPQSRYRGGAASSSLNSASRPYGSRAQTDTVCIQVCDMHLPSPHLPYVHRPHLPSVPGVLCFAVHL